MNEVELYGKGTRFGNQNPTIHIHNEQAKSLYDSPVIRDSISRWISHPFPWQQLVYRDIFSVNEQGKLFYKVVCTSIPRRNGKTEVEVGLMVVFAVMFSANVLYTANDGKLAKLTYDRFIEAATDSGSSLSSYFPGLQAKDKSHEHVVQAYDPKTGKKLGTLTFVTRGGKGGRGGTYDVVIFDEAQDLTEEQYQRYGPTNAATKKHDRGKRRNPIGLTILFGTPPPLDTKTDAVVSGLLFRNLRNEILVEQDLPWENRRKKGTAWIEWGADSVVDKNDRDAWYRFNPSMGYLGGMEEYFENSILSNEGFSVEHLGYWTKQSKDRAIEISSFNRLSVSAAELKKDLRGAKYSIALKSDLSETVIHMGIAFRKPDGNVAYEHFKSVYVDEEGWDKQLEAILVDLSKRSACVSVMVDGSLARSAATTVFIRSGQWKPMKSKVRQGKILMAQVSDVTAASSALVNAISARRLLHSSPAPLHSAVEDAKKRKIGDSGFSFTSISGLIDVVPLEVCALAVYGIETRGQSTNRDMTHDSSGRNIQKGLGAL